MKKLTSTLGWIALLAMILAHQAMADVIVNTGAPDNTGNPISLASGNWMAAEFTTTQSWQLSSIESYITGASAGMTFHVSIYDNNTVKNLPDFASQLFTQQTAFISDGWNGLTGLNNSLGAGTYWVAFEVVNSDSLDGLLPVTVANPLAHLASYDGQSINYSPVSGSAYNFGLQISAVPVPSALWLFASGLIAIGRRRLVKGQAI
jgi:hypothetical protein